MADQAPRNQVANSRALLWRIPIILSVFVIGVLLSLFFYYVYLLVTLASVVFLGLSTSVGW